MLSLCYKRLFLYVLTDHYFVVHIFNIELVTMRFCYLLMQRPSDCSKSHTRQEPRQ